ncbi:cob(I)yrinic acid a,c-diamide adenosyltransferase [Candidatus Roizmanbacteria bacterium]|nr:cob(I)yrinic acid a,c-diamide adenosyltransferase [Candidatus Roizmanbacteria bacterium]
MAIYTKTGDGGTTALFGGQRLSKGDLRIETYGKLDELTSFLGLVISKIKKKEEKILLLTIQKELYEIMAVLAGKPSGLDFLKKSVASMEKRIDKIEFRLPKLTRFILPGGTELSALFHVVRVTCRDAERSLVRFYDTQKNLTPNLLGILSYLNRLSDLFFDMARAHNKKGDALT